MKIILLPQLGFTCYEPLTKKEEKNTNSLYKCSFWVILHIWTRHNAEISISYRPECLLNYYLQNEKSITIILLNDSFYMLQTLASCQIEQFIMQSKAKRCDVMRCVVRKFMAKHLFVKDNQPSDQKMCVNVPTYQRTCGRKTNITKRKRIPLDEMQSNSAPCSCDLCQTNSEWKTMETKNCAFSTL